MFLASVKRGLLVHCRKPAEILNPLVFFLLVVSLFPLGLGPSPDQLSALAPGVVWVAALLATLMSMDLMFRGDFEDGSLDQVVTSNRPLVVYILAQIFVHWLLSGLPLVLMMPIIGLVLFVDAAGMGAMALSLLLVSPTLSLLGAIGAALTLGLSRGGLLLTIIIMPLYVPLLVLGTAMVEAGMAGGLVAAYVYWLAAILLLALSLAPLASSAAIRAAVDQ